MRFSKARKGPQILGVGRRRERPEAAFIAARVDEGGVLET